MQRKPIKAEEVVTDLGTIKVAKFADPLGYSVKFNPANSRGSYAFEVGHAEEATVDLDTMEALPVAGGTILYSVENSAQAELMDALKMLCTGTDLRYVIGKLKGIPR